MKKLKFVGVASMAIMLMAVMLFTGCKKEEATISGITISSEAKTIKIDSTFTLTYTVEPAEAKVESAEWSSSSEAVATVDQSGVVKGIAEGTATITITVNGKFTKTCTVTVEESTPIYTEGSYSGKGIKIGNVWWAPVNCGYDATNYKYGKLYQWGRKDGQGYDSSDATYPSGSNLVNSQVSDLTTLGSDKFYYGNSNWYDGTNPAANSLWGATKTDYDPCPAGWRVPTESDFTSLTSTKSWITNGGPSSNQNGYLFGTSPNQVFLPAAGSRDCTYYDASYRGDSGYYWSSSLDDDNAKYLEFDKKDADMNDTSHRANGYSVRCVQE